MKGQIEVKVQIDRQIDRQVDRNIGRQIDRKIARWIERSTYRYKGIKLARYINSLSLLTSAHIYTPGKSWGLFKSNKNFISESL